MLPLCLSQLLSHFQPAFTKPTWRKVVPLIVGTLLARGSRTVTAALRQMGLAADPNFSLYHHVLNRARWSPLQLSQILLLLLVHTFVPEGAPVLLAIDETLERRRGEKIKKLGYFHDASRSTHKYPLIGMGLRWVCMMLVVTPPWTTRPWALPFLCVLFTPAKVNAALGRRHKTVPELARQMVLLVRRWLPNTPITLLGDGAYSVHELAVACQRRGIRLIAPLRCDARLYAPAPPYRKGQQGRPRLVGHRLPLLRDVLADPTTNWHQATISWYDQGQEEIEWCSGTGLWYRGYHTLLPLRWVICRDPARRREARMYFSTDQHQSGLCILTDFMKRWSIEVTFEESRLYLGVETQRQWSDLAIERTTPCLLGLFSLTILMGAVLHSWGTLPVEKAAWYDKEQATFGTVLAAVRRHLWGNFIYPSAPGAPDLLLVPQADLLRFAQALCSSA